MGSRRLLLSTLLLGLATSLLTDTPILAQSYTTGEITGVVTDSSGAVLPSVPVALKNNDKGFTQTTSSNAQGLYRFPLLAPGSYTVSVSASGFQRIIRTVSVDLGQVATVDLKLDVGTMQTTVEVTAEAPLLSTQAADLSTSFNAQQLANLPNPGNDLSYVAQTAPGAVMNTQGGYGNFATNGISATSNLFTLNGMYDNDPFLNLNNSGATNLLLGNNEIAEATVVNNGYSGQYGGFAGAQVNYVTRSGSNAWHGNASYWWDGRVMNANGWFNNHTNPKTPRPFVNANQYAGAVGGPIKKDKAFFFFNYEGLRVVLPTSAENIVPSPQFEAATLTNLAAKGLSTSIPFYQQMFNLWNGAPGINRAVPGNPLTGDATGCGTFTGLSAGVPCALSFRSTAGNFTHEYLAAGRFDFNLTANDRMFIRLQEDKGLQATYTDPTSPLFNAQSNQPEYQGQISETHSFGSRAVNQLVYSAAFYSAIFSAPNLNAAVAAFPASMIFLDGSFQNTLNGISLGGLDLIWPQGRNVTQYQIVDDFTYGVTSNHNLKVGLNFHRYDISDHDLGIGSIGTLLEFSLNDFYNGGFASPSTIGNVFTQGFPVKLEQPIAIYGLGFYAQDEWRASSNLKLTFALRGDHNSNPVCQTNCFARLAAPFSQLDHSLTTPYNQAILINQHQALASYTNVALQPRLGLAWQPFGLKNTVIRGGIGMFVDTFPGQIADTMALNPPLFNTFTAVNDYIAPQAPTNVYSDVASSNAAFVSGFKQGLTFAQIAAIDPLFTAPNVANAANIKSPIYQEWSFGIQQGLGQNTSLTINYVGNHGIHETALFNGVNAFCPPASCPRGYAGLPSAPIDPRFLEVIDVRSAAVSNYNGLTVTGQHRFSKGFQVQANYTWGHALDEISNGGFNPFNNTTATSILNPQAPNDLRKYNYGNADYDTRHYLSANYLWEVPYRRGPAFLLRGWQLSGTVFKRSGIPYTVIDGGATGTLNSFGYGNSGNVYTHVFANFLGGPVPSCQNPDKPCLTESEFSSAANGFGAQRRNSFFGPSYFNTDFTVMKYTKFPGWEHGELGLGAQFFNVLNHPHFDQPHRDIANTATFGQITNALSTPTSILGSFLGGDASPRLIQLTAKLRF